MLVSGLVFNLSSGLAGDAAFAQLQRHPALTLGPRAGNLVPAALSTADVKQSRDFHDQMQAMPGVEYVDVVYVGFEEDSEFEPSSRAPEDVTTAGSSKATLFDSRPQRMTVQPAALPN
jgi:hypothetical protein